MPLEAFKGVAASVLIIYKRTFEAFLCFTIPMLDPHF